mgnify:CR=1 FL=1
MDNLYNKIQELCLQYEITIAKMCRDLNIPKTTFSDLKYGRRKSISIKYCAKIAAYFHIPIESLIDTPKIEVPYTSKEEYHTSIFDHDHDDKQGQTENKKVFILSEHEFKLITAYRNTPAMQKAINKLLNIVDD